MNVMMNCTAINRSVRVMAASLVVLGLNACSEGSSTASVDDEGKSSIRMVAPDFIPTRAIDYDTLLPVVTINGRDVTLSSDGEQWTGTTTVPVDTDASLSVDWIENNSTSLLLARAQKTLLRVGGSAAFEISDDDYITEGPDFDLDEDGISNIAERRTDTDPFDPNDPGMDPPPAAKIRALRRTTIIDGVVNDGSRFWTNATYTDVQGQSLRVNNLIVDGVGTYVDQSPNYQWAAIHDGTSLHILVYGKSLDGSQTGMPDSGRVEASGDSGTDVYLDDSLEIFIDGDFSRKDDYDEVDDLHLLIPLVMGPEGAREANRSNSPNKRINIGNNVRAEFDHLDESIVEFATCICDAAGQRTVWEVRIDMEAANIPTGETFGFEIQLNQDDDGGARDAKWAWWRPSRTPDQVDAESDATWVHPNLMGRIELLAFPQ